MSTGRAGRVEGGRTLRVRTIGGAWPIASLLAGTLLLAGPVLLAGCAAGPPAPTDTPTLSAKQADRDQLAGLAAAATDKRYVATYTLSTPGRGNRTVTVAVGTDGTWVVGIPGGGLGGLADIAMYGSAGRLYQCALGPAAGAVDQRPDVTVSPGCVALPRLTASVDPLVQHLFTDWIGPLVDRATALSVAATQLLPGTRGACFSVESNSAALAPPVDPGIYCYEADGVLTGARVSFGTLVLTGTVAAAPPSVVMPTPVVSRPPLSLAAPPPPPTPTPSVSPRS